MKPTRLRTMITNKKEDGPRERVESFISRRRENAGEFVKLETLSDGYVRVEFQKVTYFTPPDDKVVYKGGCGYERPVLNR